MFVSCQIKAQSRAEQLDTVSSQKKNKDLSVESIKENSVLSNQNLDLKIGNSVHQASKESKKSRNSRSAAGKSSHGSRKHQRAATVASGGT